MPATVQITRIAVIQGKHTHVDESSAPETETSGDEVKDDGGLGDEGKKKLYTALIQLGLGVPAIVAGVSLISVISSPTLPQATIFSALFSFGIAMLSAFFTGNMTFKYKGVVTASGAFALFCFLLWFLRSGSVDHQSYLALFGPYYG